MIASRSSRDVTKRAFDQLHRSQQFIVTCSRNCFGAVDLIVHSVSIAVQRGLLVARQVAQNFLVMLVSQTVSRPIGCKVHEVDVRVLLFNVINFESEVVCFVDNQREVFVVKVLCVDLRTTCVWRNADFRLFDDADGITLPGDFTEVVGVSNVTNNSCFTESELDFFGVNNGTKVTVRQVAPACSRLKSHE